MAQDPIAKPLMGELSKPEQLVGAYARSTARMSPYLDALSPTDTILQSKGGIDQTNALYRELLRDDQVASCFQQRRMAVTSKATVVEPGANDALSTRAADALREQLERLAWDDITDKMLYASFYGWAVAEVIWRPSGSMVEIEAIVARDRSRFRFGWSGALYLQTTAGLVEMPPRKFWTLRAGGDTGDNPYGLGLAHALYWPCWFKRNGTQFWMTFLERFAQPTAVAKLPPGMIESAEQRGKALEMLRQIASDAGVVCPDNVAVELLEASRSGTAEYGALQSAMDSAIAKVILSQTMTTDNGSSLSQARVHMGVRDEVVKADADLLNEAFADQVAAWWTAFNFPGAAVPKVRRDIAPPEDLNARADRDAKVFSMGFAPTEDYIATTYGEGWEKKETPAPLLAAAAGDPNAPPPPDNGGNAQDSAGAQFADPPALAALRAGRRADQDALVEAAARFAEQYDTVMGRQIGALLDSAEAADDYETFRNRLAELLEAPPAPGALEKLTRAGLFARLMGASRAARRASRRP